MAFPLSDEEHRAIKARIEAVPELVVAAAVRYDGAVVMFPRPGRHGDTLNWLHHHGVSLSRSDARDHGFLTSHGRFVDRLEAARLVVATGQGSPNFIEGYAPALFSEDMWNDHFTTPTEAIKPEEVF